ncbi:DUF2511 domain-containing protein [Pseudomonas jilinensis]|uniref:DUF2511 domain-containing protein n=1 Tax=Pseudomonas jilinensis TaxID=2078689 RepID=A0A396RZ15_9PSED|nr:DUF2511 domain-containing protein [Pseudomonas jilinensis]RHW21709.1 hypothetical protein C2846_07090 [Pseudomonas jilinensis]
MELNNLRPTLLSLALMAAAGCGSDAATDQAPNTETTQAKPGIVLISEEDFGDRWPFTQPEMHLTCLPGNAVVVMDVNSGVMYPVNGVANGKAQQMGMESLQTIWLENPNIEGTKISVGPIIEQGLSLCI